MQIGDPVWFTAPYNVSVETHGLEPGQIVEAVITDDYSFGWYGIEYDRVINSGALVFQREISAQRSELKKRDR